MRGCGIPKGNPADVAIFASMMEKRQTLPGTDGGFSSEKKLRTPKVSGV
jgi:hypothetical protein